MYQPRTKGEAILDVRYASRLHFLHCRLYRRTKWFLACVSLASGMTAFAMVFTASEIGVAISGVLVAACSIIDATGNLSDKATLHKQWRTDLLELLARSECMSLGEIDAAWLTLRCRMDDEIGALCTVAMNDNLRSNGFESEMRPETRVQRFLRAIA